MLIDTHAHLNFLAYDDDREEVIKRCQEKNLKVVTVGAQYQTSQSAVKLAGHYDFIYAAVGLHPLHVFDEPFKLADYQNLITDKVVAVGETGFDYWHFKYLKEPFKIVLLHGWGGSKDERFFIWLDNELTKLGHKVIRFNFPETDNPNKAAWLKELAKQVGYVNGKTLLVGFSLGGVTALRFLEGLDEDGLVGGVYLLGTPTKNLGYNEIANFLDTSFDYQRIKNACKNFKVYASENDDVVPLEHGQTLAKELATEVKIIPNAWHFTVEELPDLLNDIKKDIENISANLPTIDQVIAKQKEVFLQEIELAKKNDLALILHGRNPSTALPQLRSGAALGAGEIENRDVYQEMLAILKEQGIRRAVFHFYGGDLATAKEIVKAGYYLGIDGPVTFDKKVENLQDIAKEIPLTNLLIETDCPYLSPEPHRGEKNEPAYVELVAQKIAELKNLTIEEVINQTGENAKRLFKIDN